MERDNGARSQFTANHHPKGNPRIMLRTENELYILPKNGSYEDPGAKPDKQ